MLTLVPGYVPKEFRDVIAGLVVLTMMLAADRRSVGAALLVEAIIPLGRHVNRSGVGQVEVASVLHSWRNLRGDACRRPLVDPCRLRGMPVTVLVDREGKRKLVRFLITGENSERPYLS